MRRHFLAPFFLSLACGGPQQPTKEVTTLPSASASVAPPPTVDLSPVAMPPAVVAVVHASHGGATADMVSEWTGQTLPVEQPFAEMVGERMAKLIDFDSPADMTLSVEDRGGNREPEARIALAFAVKDFEGAKAQLQGEYGLVPIANGAFEIKRSGSHRRDGDSDFRSCAIAPGKTGGKIVCSHDATARDAVLPYLTRGVGNLAAIKSDLHIEARPGPLREIVHRDRASIIQGGSRWMGSDVRTLAEAALADFCDGFLDSERASLDATLDAKQGMVDLKITTKGSQTGLITRILAGHPDRAEPPPALFLRLPDDADIALFEHGIDPGELASPRTQIIAWLDNGLASTSSNVNASDRKAIVDAVTHSLDVTTMPIVYARGVDFSKAVPAVSGLTETSDASKIRAGIEQAAGWEIFGIESAPEKITAMLKEWTAILARPSSAAWNHGSTKLRLGATPRNAPAGTIQLTLTQENDDTDWSSRQPNGQYKKRPPLVLTMHTLVVPDGAHVWIVNALDEATAVNRARMLTATSATNTLATRAGLDAIRNTRGNAGGFITPRAIGLGLPVMWLTGWNLRSKIANDPLVGVSSQSQYTTPITLTASESGQNDEKSLTLNLRVTRAVVTDVLAVAPHIFH